jgi:DNA-binding SARP family transcriptional activator
VPADHYLVATSGGIGLRLANLSVDLETFLSEADLGLRLETRGDAAGGYTALSSAARHYGGDFCEDEPYESWSAQAREEARAGYLRVLRSLARLSAGTGRVDEATGHLLRLLHLDPYDEQCHRDLVELLTRAGRHGEARRAQARYEAAMRELGLTPAGSDTRG